MAAGSTIPRPSANPEALRVALNATGPTWAITNARIVTVSGPVIPKGTIVIKGNRIDAVGANVPVPSGARTVNAAGANGLFYGGGVTLLGKQLVSVIAVAAFCALASFVILKVVQWVAGLRVAGDVEAHGLDLALHGERAYATESIPAPHLVLELPSDISEPALAPAGT